MSYTPPHSSKSARILSIDYGLARIGLAHSDPFGMMATPLPAIQVKTHLTRITPQAVAGLLLKIIATFPFPIQLILMGNPIHLDGAASNLSKQVALIQEELIRQGSPPVELIDERLSTSQTQRTLKEAGLNRKERSGVIDSATAALLLNTYLELHQKGSLLPPI